MILKDKVKLVNLDNITNKSDERELFDNISRGEFFNWLSDHGYDRANLKLLFENKRVNSSEQNRFNAVLKRAKVEIEINISDSVLYLEDSFVKLKKILTLLDEDVRYILKCELEEKYKIKSETAHLDELIG